MFARPTFSPLWEGRILVLRHLPVVRILHPVREDLGGAPNVGVATDERLFAREPVLLLGHSAVADGRDGGIVAQVADAPTGLADAVRLAGNEALRLRLPEPAAGAA